MVCDGVIAPAWCVEPFLLACSLATVVICCSWSLLAYYGPISLVEGLLSGTFFVLYHLICEAIWPLFLSCSALCFLLCGTWIYFCICLGTPVAPGFPLWLINLWARSCCIWVLCWHSHCCMSCLWAFSIYFLSLMPSVICLLGIS